MKFIIISVCDRRIMLISDDRIITIPLGWVPKLESVTKEVRESYIIRGHFVLGKH